MRPPFIEELRSKAEERLAPAPWLVGLSGAVAYVLAMSLVEIIKRWLAS